MKSHPKVRNCWQLILLGEGKLGFFKGMALSGLITLQWMASYTHVYGQHKLDLWSSKAKTQNTGHREVWETWEHVGGGQRMRRVFMINIDWMEFSRIIISLYVNSEKYQTIGFLKSAKLTGICF